MGISCRVLNIAQILVAIAVKQLLPSACAFVRLIHGGCLYHLLPMRLSWRTYLVDIILVARKARWSKGSRFCTPKAFWYGRCWATTIVGLLDESCLNTFGTESCVDIQARAPTPQAPAGMDTGETVEFQAPPSCQH